MKELKINASEIVTIDDYKQKKTVKVNPINLLQFDHSNQTLVQDNGGMHKDAVTLMPDQLLELIRNSETHLHHLKNAYLAEVIMSITEANGLINARLITVIDPHLVLFLQAEFDKNLAYADKAKYEFYGKRHESFLNEVKASHEAIIALFARPEAATDEGLLEIFKVLHEPVTFPLLSPVGMNPFPGHVDPSRLQMYAEIDVNETYPKADEDQIK